MKPRDDETLRLGDSESVRALNVKGRDKIFAGEDAQNRKERGTDFCHGFARMGLIERLYGLDIPA